MGHEDNRETARDEQFGDNFRLIEMPLTFLRFI